MKTYKVTYKTRDGYKDFEYVQGESSSEVKREWELDYPTTTIVSVIRDYRN